VGCSTGTVGDSPDDGSGVRLVLDVDRDPDDRLAGWVEAGGRRVAFRGILELVAVIDGAVPGGHGADGSVTTAPG